jgi:hypothetical protein
LGLQFIYLELNLHHVRIFAYSYCWTQVVVTSGASASAVPAILVLTRHDTDMRLGELPGTFPPTCSCDAKVAKRRMSWMQQVEDQQTWLVNHQFCAFELPVDLGPGGQPVVIDGGRGGDGIDRERRAVCEHIFETDLTFKLPHR